MPYRILFLAYGLDAVSCRFRIFQYVPYLRQMGMRVDVADLRARAPQRWRTLQSASAYDAVVIHRAFLNPLEQRWLRRGSAGYVFDFDDAIMFRDSSHRRLDSWQRRWRFQRMVSGARRVIAGNSLLAAWAARYSNRVTIIPTPVDVHEYPLRNAVDGREHIVGWIGTRINLMYLRTVLPALTRLARAVPNLRLKIVSDDFLDVPGIQVIKKRWSRPDEARDLMSFQVGIMPLVDDPWTRGKCGVKLLQYFAASLPVVCSPVGANFAIVEPGRNGYFASTQDEWVARLADLLEDEGKCRRFGAVGRATVERTYSVEANVALFAKALA